MLGGRTGGWGLVPSVLVPVMYANFVVSLSPVMYVGHMVSVGPMAYVSPLVSVGPMVYVGPVVSVGPVVYVGHVVLLCATIRLEDDLNGKVGFAELCLAGFCEVKVSAKKMVWMLNYSFLLLLFL